MAKLALLAAAALTLSMGEADALSRVVRVCVHVGLCGLLQRPESGDGRAKVVHEISSPHAEPDMHPRTGLFERSQQ